MIELLVLIMGVTGIFMFSKSLKALAIASESKTQVFAEEVISEAVQERADILSDFKENTKDKDIVSHDDMLKTFKVS
jgi:hypothetical protein